MGAHLGPDFPSDIGLAVSGGGDSMAMLALAHEWARVWGVRLWVVTVDHGLRPEAADEAAMVARECAALGHPHATLRWAWDGVGNMQARAREARLALIDQWRGVVTHVLMAHTRDDVAETYLIRLARQAGVEGLAAMQAKRRVELGAGNILAKESYDGQVPPPFEPGGTRAGWFHIVRPCLDMGREELRHYIRTLSVPWADDPSNEDPAYERVRARQALRPLTDLGVDVEVLAGSAVRMARAADALRARAAQVWAEIGQEGRMGDAPTGEILFSREGFEEVERETQMRLLSYALSYVAGQSYRPREAPLEALLERLLGGGGGTLHGCEVRMERDQCRVFREYAAVADETLAGAAGGAVRLWDGRWHMRCAPGTRVRALGEDGWALVETVAEGAPPFVSARSLPSLWRGGRLLACPGVGFGQAPARLWPMGKEMFSFRAFILSH
ncbi:tRNA lysidine(34) synthetase TilS [Roseobacteraceae bacterium S113]